MFNSNGWTPVSGDFRNYNKKTTSLNLLITYTFSLRLGEADSLFQLD